MADSVIQAIVGKLVEYSVDAIKNQMSYLCCYSSNVQKLADEVEKLNNKHQTLQRRVHQALANSEVITPEVEAWLKTVEDSITRSNEICDAAEQVKRKSTCLCKHSWIPMMHYCLSRKACKTTNNCVQLQTNNFDVISTPRMLADIPPVPMSTNVSFESRVVIENKIMDALKDPSVYSIGILGTGGIGKTVMAKTIKKRVWDEKLFESVIMVIVSQQLDIQKMQDHIANKLGLQFKGDSPISRQEELHQRLMDEKHNILIILDDVWERLDLEEIGIPSQSIHAGCKLILTSRNADALIGKIIPMEMLNEKESWKFFADNAGIHVNGDDSCGELVQIAKKVERDCKGLPLALKIVACALKGKGLSSWKNALRELEKHAPVNIPNVIKDVYGSLQFSIDALEGKEQKDLFLLCCLFPEDYSISLDELLTYGIGLRIFMETENLTETRDKVEALLTILVSRSLLLEGEKDHSNFNVIIDNLLLEGEKEHGIVRMHDVIRDVGIWIKREKFLIKHGLNEWPMGHDDFFNNYTCISLQFSHQRVSFPESIVCPKLELLCLHSIWRKDRDFNELPESFFSGMGGLRALEASYTQLLPPSMNQLNNLRTLSLKHGRIMDTVSVLGNLINLEMLTMKNCNFEVLPLEIGELKCLKQMNIVNCPVQRIAYGVLSRLARLEELIIWNSFDDWLAEAGGEDVACLSELNSLKNLTTLKIEIRNPNALPREKPLWTKKVVKYSIIVSSNNIPYKWNMRDEMSKFQNSVALGNDIVNLLGDWIYDMAIDAKYVALEGSSCQKFSKWLSRNYGNLRCLKSLSLFQLHNIQCLAQGQYNEAIFPKLETLHVENSTDLQQIFEVSPPIGSLKALQSIQLAKSSGLLCLWKSSIKEQLYLGNLQQIEIDQCDNLSYLFSLSVAQSLEMLTDLKIKQCRGIKEIFKNEDEKAMEIKLPKLKKMWLENLDSFYYLCSDFIGIELPELDNLWLLDLQSMNKAEGDYNNEVHQEYFIPKGIQLVGINPNFLELKHLVIGGTLNFKCIFSPSIISSGLPNLSSLEIRDYSMVEQVIGKVDEKVREAIILPNLNKLVLTSLPNMRSFCYNATQFPSLEQLTVNNCPLMLKFVEELDNHSSSSRPFLDEWVECPNLNYLRLSSLSIAEAFSSFFFKSLTILKSLSIIDCKGLEFMIANEEEKGGQEQSIQSIPLWSFSLIGLPKLHTSIFQMKHHPKFPLLNIITIKDCPVWEKMSFESLHFPNLRCVQGFSNCGFTFHFSSPIEESSEEIYSDNNCFIIFIKDIAFKGQLNVGDSYSYILTPQLRERFLNAIWIQFSLKTEIVIGKFKVEKIQEGMEYEIMLIMWKKYECEDLIKIELKLPQGTKFQSTKTLEKHPSRTWIAISFGKFVGESKEKGNQDFEFSLDLSKLTPVDREFLWFKGIRIVEV